MTFNAVEIITLVFVLVGLSKMFMIFFSSKSWGSFIKEIYSKPKALFVIEFIFAAIVLYYLLHTLTIVEIMGGVVFGALLTSMAFANYGKEFRPIINKVFKKNLFKKSWLLFLIWFILLIWVLGELFNFF